MSIAAQLKIWKSSLELSPNQSKTDNLRIERMWRIINWMLPNVKQLIMAEYWKKMKNLHVRNKKSKLQTRVEHTKLFNAQEMDVKSSKPPTWI
jgi:hypothetical protein